MLASLLGFIAVWCWWGRPRRRVGPTTTAQASGGRPSERPLAERWWVRSLACPSGGGGLGWVIAGSGGAIVGVAGGAVLAWWLGRLEPAGRARERELVSRDLPIAAELLAACTTVGAPLDRSLAVVADALGGPLATRLRAVLIRLELGADPVGVWRELEPDAELGGMARTVVRAIESGAAPADGLARLAADRRRDRRAVLQGRARSVAVRSAGPLAACFLPAFMLVGVVPIVVGVFSQLGL